MRKTLTSFLILFFFLGKIVAQQIPSNFFGVNYWMPNQIPITSASGYPNGAVSDTNVLSLIRNTGLNLYRIGGDGYDKNGTDIGVDETDNDYLAAMFAVRSIDANAQFLIQIPYESSLTSLSNMNSAKAKILVQRIMSVYNTEHFYFAIGNEWDMYSGFNDYITIKDSLKAYVKQMKRADPLLKIVAPAAAYFAATDSNSIKIVRQLIRDLGDDTITGTGTAADGKYYLDVIDFHNYGPHGNMNNSGAAMSSGMFDTIRNDLINYPAGAYATDISTDSTKLRGLLDSVNAFRSASPLTWAVTEMNVCYKAPHLSSSMSTNYLENTAKGIGPRSFFAGQYWADMCSQTLKNGTVSNSAKVEFICPWSIHENGGSGMTDTSGTDLGMTKGLASSSVQPTPLSTYYHYQMLASHFDGKYCSGGSTVSGIKAFGSKACDEIAVMIINQNLSGGNVDFSLRLNTVSSGTHVTAKINIDAGIDRGYYDTIGPQSTMLLLFDGCGRPRAKYRYNVNHAVNDATPTLYNLTTPSTVCTNCLFGTPRACEVPGSPDVDTMDLAGKYVIDTSLTMKDIIRVRSGDTLVIDSSEVVFLPGSGIIVERYGKLISHYSMLHGCEGALWDGIHVSGQNDTTKQIQLYGCILADADTLIDIYKNQNIVISECDISKSKKAIKMDQCRGFTITRNTFHGLGTSIATVGAGSGTSLISENYFTSQDECIVLNGGNHSLLDIVCNTFDDYDQYAIRSISCTMKNQGDATNGAGNTFMTASTNTNHQFLHDGNNINYYAGPSDTITLRVDGTKHATVRSASNDGCFGDLRISELASDESTTAVPVSGIQIVPNPSRDRAIVYFENPEKGSKTELMIQNVYGTIISRQVLDPLAGRKEIDVSQFKNGIYLCSIFVNGNMKVTGKMVVAH